MRFDDILDLTTDVVYFYKYTRRQIDHPQNTVGHVTTSDPVLSALCVSRPSPLFSLDGTLNSSSAGANTRYPKLGRSENSMVA